MTPFATEQENFWAGDFGDEYTQRSRGQEIVAANTSFFARILSRLPKLGSVVELGANIGMNLLRAAPTASRSAPLRGRDQRERCAGTAANRRC